MAANSGQWNNNTAFLLAATGSAVGLGNIWGFPYKAGENGGGLFVLLYIFFVINLGSIIQDIIEYIVYLIGNNFLDNYNN